MALNNLDLKKLYYYVICVMAFFVLMWGTVDLASTSIGLLNIQGISVPFSSAPEEGAISTEKGEQFFDAYYQRKMLQDRLWDSLARIVISSMIFAYFRYSVNKLESQG